MAATIYHDFKIKAPLEKVFNAFSQPHHLVNWWPKRCEGTPKEGEGYHFFFSEKYDWYGKVTRYHPNKSFHISMTEADSDWLPTTFGFDLEAYKSDVLVKFFHSGWENINAHFRHTSFCWALLLQGLKNYVEKDIIIPFEERE